MPHPTNEGLVKVADRPRGEQIFAGISEYRGKKFFNLRSYYLSNSGELLPGKQGLTLPLAEVRTFSANLANVVKQVSAQLPSDSPDEDPAF